MRNSGHCLLMEYLGKLLSPRCRHPLLLPSNLSLNACKTGAISSLVTPNQNTVSNYDDVLALNPYFLCVLLTSEVRPSYQSFRWFLASSHSYCEFLHCAAEFRPLVVQLYWSFNLGARVGTHLQNPFLNLPHLRLWSCLHVYTQISLEWFYSSPLSHLLPPFFSPLQSGFFPVSAKLRVTSRLDFVHLPSLKLSLLQFLWHAIFWFPSFCPVFFSYSFYTHSRVSP